MQSYKSNVEQLSTVLENVDGAGNVIAPISGTLVTLDAEENAFVSPSMPVGRHRRGGPDEDQRLCVRGPGAQADHRRQRGRHRQRR